MTGGIFISYRRDDARWAAGRLADALESSFGAQHIFRDVDRIEPGADFVQVLESRLADCAVMLVLMGPKWLSISDGKGQRRLDDPQDWIRLEIATALKRNIRVIPVLLDGVVMPTAAELPAELASLPRRQALELADTRFDADTRSLIDTLQGDPILATVHQRRNPPATPKPDKQASRWPVFAGAIAAGIVTVMIGANMVDGDSGPTPEQLLAQAPTAAGVPSAAATLAAATPAPTTPVLAPAPDLAGLWRTNSGESYEFHQDGRSIRIDVEMGGERVGSGRATLEGHLVRATISVPVWGQVVTSNCNLQATPDLQSLMGMCQNPGGSFPAQLFR